MGMGAMALMAHRLVARVGMQSMAPMADGKTTLVMDLFTDPLLGLCILRCILVLMVPRAVPKGAKMATITFCRHPKAKGATSSTLYNRKEEANPMVAKANLWTKTWSRELTPRTRLGRPLHTGDGLPGS